MAPASGAASHSGEAMLRAQSHADHRHWLVGSLVFSAAVVFAMMVWNRLALDVTNSAFGAVVALVALLGTVRFRLRRPATFRQARLRDFAESLLFLLGISLIGAVASYEAAARTTGFYDAYLAHGDRMLRFDWLSWYMVVVHHPALQQLGAAAYGSVYFTPVLMLGWMAWHGERTHSQRFLMTFWLASVITIALFPLLPARGALEFMWHGPISYMPTNGLYQGEIIPALRAHQIPAIELASIRGIVCAPSFHTVCAIVYMVFAWPFARLRLIVVPLNIAMLVATPVEGTHYLTDIVLGAMVAIVAVATIRALTMRFPAHPNPSHLARAS